MFRLRRSQIAFTAGIAGLTLLAAGCGSSSTPAADPADPSVSAPASSSQPPSPTDGGTLTFAVGNDPINLNPSGTGSGNDTLYVTRQLFDSLTEQDPQTGELLPWLAESFSAAPDATSFTFTLRSGVTFSDGTPLTSGSVKATFDDIVANGADALSAIPYFTGYVGTTVVDDRTFTVSFGAPNGPFLQATSSVALAPVAAATLAVPFAQRGTGAELVGTGPFTLDHYTKNTEAVLTKRADYGWGPGDRANTGAAHLDRVVFKIVPESGVRTGSLDSGQVQVIGGVAPQDISSLGDAGHSLVIRANPGLVFGLSPVETRPIVADPTVREALALSVNAADVRDAALNDNFAVATSSLARNTPGWADESGSIVFDPDRAASLLDGAGWTVGADGVRAKDGQKLRLVLAYINNFGPNQAAVELIQQQFKDVGVEVELWTGTVPDLRSGLQNGSFDLVWANLSRSDGDVLRTQFSTTGTNWYKIDDADLEAAFAGQLSTADQAARDRYLASAQQILIDKHYNIPVVELTTVLASSPDVFGVSLGADSRLSQLTDAFVSG